MKEDNTPTVTARRRAPSAKLRLRLENSKRLKKLNEHSKTVRLRKKDAKLNAGKTDPEDRVEITRLPKIKKNNLAAPPTATTKWKKRQTQKTWLPTHLWHAKRAHMTRPAEPLWRMAIPISPTEKCYRPTHRASGARGCVAWDASYMATIDCHGREASLEGLVHAIGFDAEGWTGAKFKRWKIGARSARGWVYERDNEKQAIAPVIVIWEPEKPTTESAEARAAADKQPQEADTDMPDINTKKTKPKPKKTKASNRRLFIRVHPSTFHELWLLLIKVAKIQKPQVMLEDLRFEIGSIEITGPGSTEALLGVLKPVDTCEPQEDAPEHVWKRLAGLNNPAALPQNCLLSFDISDPRLQYPPKQVDVPEGAHSETDLMELTATWPLDTDRIPRTIFSHKARYLASKSLPSQKAINRRKTLAPPGQAPRHKTTDPKIPVLLLANKPDSGASGIQGSWTVLLPWKCVDPVWRSLMFYPLSSGGTPRFGGLDETRQICFESGRAWFPGDFPGTAAGQAWERTENARRFDHWARRPTSRRIAWDTVDLGNGKKGEHGRGWACDWEYELTGRAAEAGGALADHAQSQASAKTGTAETDAGSPPRTQRQRKALKAKRTAKDEEAEDGAQAVSAQVDGGPDEAGDFSMADAAQAAEPTPEPAPDKTVPPFVQLTPTLALSLLKKWRSIDVPAHPSLVTICITLLGRGTPKPCARICRLPSDATLRKQWLALDNTAVMTSNTPCAIPSPKLHHKPRISKDKVNHRGDARRHEVYPLDSPDWMNYIPPDAPPEFFKTPEYLQQKAAYDKWKAAQEEGQRTMPTPEDRVALAASLMVVDHNTVEHPACPDANELIGFVTTGSHNLAEGIGTAIGSIWVQRLIEGWRAEAGCAPVDKQAEKQRERQRHLVIVRNAGESVGRLGYWTAYL